MYITLTPDIVLLKKSVVSVFDIEKTTGSETTRAFLRAATKRGEVISATQDLPRSLILCRDRGKTVLYVSELSVTALRRRLADNSAKME